MSTGKKGQASNPNDLRQSLHKKARQTKKQSSASKHTPLYYLLQQVEAKNIEVKPQCAPFLDKITLLQQTAIKISPSQTELSPLYDLTLKNHVISFHSDHNENIKDLNFNFSLFPNTQYFSFTNGGLEQFEKSTFEKTKLSDISLNNNKIHTIQRLPRLPFRLRRLDLSHNKLTSLNFLKASDLRNLTELELSNNLISSIQPLAESNLRYLITLSLGNNSISNLNPLPFIDFKNLKKLDLSNNQISQIKQIKTLNISNFNWIQLSGNRINDFTPILEMKFKDRANVFNVYVEDYFPGIYIRENQADEEELQTLFKNSKFKLYTGEVVEDDWEELYNLFGRYDNYGEDEKVREKEIRENEVNSLEGDVLSEVELGEQEVQEEKEQGSNQNQEEN